MDRWNRHNARQSIGKPLDDKSYFFHIIKPSTI